MNENPALAPEPLKPQPKRSLSLNPDLFIAGGGPAGLACAIAAANQGLSVVIADSLRPPVDKPCGEGLMPDSLADLAALGVDPLAVVNAPLHGIRFLSDDAATQADFPAEYGRGIRRSLLHQLLIDRASALGVRFQWETVVRGLERGTILTNRQSVHPRWIVGADGHASRIRSAAGLDRGTIASQRAGLQQHFSFPPGTNLWTNHVEVHWSDHGQAYATPVSSNEVCVIFLAPVGARRRKFASLDETLACYPTLARRVAHAVLTGPTRGAFTMNRLLHRVSSGNLALLGDASGSVDAVTGEGLALCFRQAPALAAALVAGELSRYETAHRAIRRLPSLMSHTMLLLDRSTFLRENALRAFSRRPALFQRLLEVHTGERSMCVFGGEGLLHTGLQILANSFSPALSSARSRLPG